MVDPQRLKRIREVFETALRRAPATRQNYLREVCAGDTDLHSEVRRLLEAHEVTSDMLDRPASVFGHTLAEGDVIGERFRIVRLIGRGGMGQVYEARDLNLHRTVALKVLPVELTHEEAARRRLRREARILAALRHPQICALFDILHDGHRDILVMEYLEGESLATRLHRAGAIAIPILVEIASQVCSALQYAHTTGILHRDLKPANIMLTAEGAKLLDFGIARFTSMNPRTGSTATLTEEAGVLGTVHYMSPEQALGRTLDSRSDLFSLGVVLYQMATATFPFDGETVAQVLSAIVNEEPRSVRNLNPALPVVLEDVIRHCLEKDRSLDTLQQQMSSMRCSRLLNLESRCPAAVPRAFQPGMSGVFGCSRQPRLWLLAFPLT